MDRAQVAPGHVHICSELFETKRHPQSIKSLVSFRLIGEKLEILVATGLNENYLYVGWLVKLKVGSRIKCLSFARDSEIFWRYFMTACFDRRNDMNFR